MVGDSLDLTQLYPNSWDHVSVGFSYNIDKNNEIGMSYMYALKAKEFGQNQDLSGPQSGYLEMDQHDIEFNWGYRF